MENGDKIQFTKDIATLKAEMNYVKAQVSNHIPTSIKELDDRLDDIERKLAKWGGAIIVILAIVQFLINKFL